MPNLRILADNASDRAILTASSQASSVMAPANLASDSKSTVWRSAAGTTARLSAAWAAAETIGCVALPFCNLSPTATMRVRLTNEASTPNFGRGSETFDDASGWSGGAISVPAGSPKYRGIVPYTAVSKATSSLNESRALSVGGVPAGATYTLTIALRAGTASAVGIGIYDGLASGTFWGDAASSTAQILEGPGSIAQESGGLWDVYGLSASADTLLKVTRTFTATASMVILIYPGTSQSNSPTANVLATRLMVESGFTNTSYYPAGTTNTVRPLGYIDSWQSYAYDSGAVLCCPAGAVLPRGFTAAQAANAYAFGGGAFARLWLPPTPAVGLAVDIADPNNLQGYIEASRLVAGNYWSPRVNPDWGSASETPLDFSKNFRKESGDLVSNRSARSRKMNFTLSTMQASDRTALASVIRANGITYPFLVSLFPDDTDPALERDHMIWGNLTALSAMTITCWNGFTKALEFEEK